VLRCRPHQHFANLAQASLPDAAALIPVVGPFTLFRHGQDTSIETSTPFTAYLVPPALGAAAR
jgi:hypothetical protein